MEEGQAPKPGTYRECIAAAERALRAGDLDQVLRVLYGHQMMDALTRIVHHRHDGLRPEDVDDVVVEAVRRLYVKVSNGEEVRDFGSYITTVARGLAAKIQETLIHEEGLDGNASVRSVSPEDVVLGLDRESLTEEQWGQLFKSLRFLLSTLQMGTVREVMTYVVDMYEQGVEDPSDGEIAEALAVNVASVRVWRFRGCQRLRERARMHFGVEEFSIGGLRFLCEQDSYQDDEG